MLFREIKQNYPVHIFNKQDLTIEKGKATAVSLPRLEMNPNTGKTEMVVDVTIDVDGRTATYAIPENLSVTYAGSIVLSTDEQGLSGEIESTINAAEKALSSMEYYKKVKEVAPSLLAQINPEYREKQQTEKRFNQIETSIGRMEELMTKQQEMMANFIKKFES